MNELTARSPDEGALDRTEHLALPAPRNWRNPALGQVGDALTALADTCVHPLIVVPLFIAGLAESTVTVGLAVALVLAAAALAYPLAAALPAAALRAGGQRALLQIGGLAGAVGLRALLFFMLAGAAVGFRQPHAGQLTQALLLLTATGFLAGFAEPLRLELASGSSAEAPLGNIRVRWALVGALAAVVGALASRSLLSRAAGYQYPAGFVQIFVIAGLVLTLVTICVLLMRPVATPAAERGIVAQLAAFTALTIDNLAYGRFVFFRFLYTLGAIADPFYILYATRELGGDVRTAGAYLLALAVARAIGVVFWRALGLQGGNRLVLQLAAFVRLLAPITALTLPPLLGSATLRDRLPGGNATSLAAFGLVFAAYGAASAGVDLAAPAIQAAITTPRERPAAAAVTHLALGGAALGALAGGLIADRLGFRFLFIGALVAGLVVLLAGGLVDEPNVVVMRAPPSERFAARRRRRPTGRAE